MNFGNNFGPGMHGLMVASPIVKFDAVDWGGGGI